MATGRKRKKARPEKKTAAANAATVKRGKNKRSGASKVARGKKSAARAGQRDAKAEARVGSKKRAAPKARAGRQATGKKATGKKASARKSIAKKTVAKKTVAKTGRTKNAAPASAGKRRAVPPARKATAPRPPAAAIGTAPPATRRGSGSRERGAIPISGRVPRAARRGGMARSRPRLPAAAKRGVLITGQMGPRYDEILTADALAFLAGLHRRFDSRRKELLALRAAQQARYDAGAIPDFLKETRTIREGDWKVAPIPQDLLDRRVEITGPVDRKMVINALNCGANMYMADFEDANSPTWDNNIEGQINLKDRWAGTLDFTDPVSGKDYRVGDKTATLIVRPRGWHLLEEHILVDGEPIAGGLVDFGLYFFHNARPLIAQGTRPYFYLPKLETHLEARLWNDVFVYAQEQMHLPTGLIKATVLIETLPAAFEMDEILYELRDHIAGLNAGRWDYIFSFIKKLAKNPNYVLPDRSQVVMGKAFLHAYALLLIRTCHRRGAFAMGGMAAQIPVRGDPQANEEAFARVRADKEREARDGHDGTWVAHPDLVPVAKEVFDRLMPQPNQLDRLREDVHVTRDDLLEIHAGTKTEEGFRHNIRVGVQYIEAWLRGRGAVPIYNMMEDAATAEISRAQIWQWIKYGVVLDTGVKATPGFFRRALAEEMERVRGEIGPKDYDAGRFPEAIDLFSRLSLADEFEDFLTIPAYKLLG
jgi:malate synthase